MNAENIINIQNKLKSYRSSKETAIKEMTSSDVAIKSSEKKLKRLYRCKYGAIIRKKDASAKEW